MPTPRSRLDWQAHRSRIEELYWTHDQELPKVMEIMEAEYGFVARPKTYKKYIKAWGLAKNSNADESMAMYRIAQHRRLTENKDTEFFRRGKLVKPGNLRRFARRRGLPTDRGRGSSLDEQIATPPNITYRTPEPGGPNHAVLPSAPTPDSPPAPATDTGEPNDPTEPPASYGLGGSPSTAGIPLESPASALWGAGDAYLEPQGQAGGLMRTDLFPAVYPVDRGLDGGHGFPQSRPAVAHTQDAWPGHDAYLQPGGYSAHVSLGSFAQPSQHIDALGQSITEDSSVFPDALAAGMGNAVLDVNAFGDPGPTHEMHRIPGASLCVLDYTPLHNAVVCNQPPKAAALLEAGADPCCAARGGITPLHYAAYQRNAVLAKTLLDYGANLDAVTDHGRTILFFAIRNKAHLGDKDMLAYANRNSVGSGSHTDDDTFRVIHAIFNGPTRWIHLRHSLDKADRNGLTPLMVAAGEGFLRTADLLLKSGARPEVRDHANHTALKYAALSNHRDMVRLLLQADGAVSVKRDLSHILKLATKNFTPPSTAAASLDGAGGGHGDIWAYCHRYASALIAEEMVRLCHEMGMLDGLLRLARQRCKTNVLELLSDAMKKLALASAARAGAPSG